MSKKRTRPGNDDNNNDGTGTSHSQSKSKNKSLIKYKQSKHKNGHTHEKEKYQEDENASKFNQSKSNHKHGQINEKQKPHVKDDVKSKQSNQSKSLKHNHTHEQAQEKHKYHQDEKAIKSKHPKQSNQKHIQTNEKKKHHQDKPQWSKSKKKRMRQQRRKLQHQQHNQKQNSNKDSDTTCLISISDSKNVPVKDPDTNNNTDNTILITDTGTSVSHLTPKHLSSLQQSFHQQLTISKFRNLNEQLYTQHSHKSHEFFQNHQDVFRQYHEGYRIQVKSWPLNPLNVILGWIKRIHKQKLKYTSLTSATDIIHTDKHTDTIVASDHKLVIADFGCGEAHLAKHLHQHHPTRFIIYSFDFIAMNKYVTACDMRSVPLEDDTVDIAVFCLSLMGTNMVEFIREAYRLLKMEGVLMIGEVRSRFETMMVSNDDDSTKLQEKDLKWKKKSTYNNNKKKDSTVSSDISILEQFLKVMTRLGFNCNGKNERNKMFVLWKFVKNGCVPEDGVEFQVKACLYKKR